MLDDNKALARRWFEQVWNQKSEAAVDEMFSPQGKAYGFPQPESVVTGPEAFKQLQRDFTGAFPDLQITIDDLVAEGDVVAVRWHAEATHKGHHLGFPATGKRVSVTGSSFLAIEQGKIVDGWNHMDLTGLIRRLQQS